MNRDGFDLPGELDALSLDLKATPGELTEEEIEAPLSWLEREVRAGRTHVLPPCLVPAREGQAFVRRYEGVDLDDV